jgi:hypothetical protein
MALWWSGRQHDTPGMADQLRDYASIEKASQLARAAIHSNSIVELGGAIAASYALQLGEGMDPLPEAAGCLGRKYSGGGFGGYALYLFGTEEARTAFVTSNSSARAIEPYSSWE